MRTAGLHLMAHPALVGTPRPSCIAEIDTEGRLVRLDMLGPDDEIAAAVAPDTAILVVDAPLAVPNDTGRRDVEVLLSWLDCPVFPNSRRRLEQVAGGLRGEILRPRLEAPGRRLLETVPDVVLREIAWEEVHPPGGPPLGIADYREAWLGVRAPRYRPKGPGRAHPAGIRAAWDLLARVVDLGGWTPHPAPDDWRAIADAACIDAVCCAYAARRLADAPSSALVAGNPERGEVVVPADASMRARAAVNLDRLRASGEVRI